MVRCWIPFTHSNAIYPYFSLNLHIYLSGFTDSPKTFIDITTNLEFFHPVGDARYGRTDFQGASRACQVAGGSLASQSNLLLLQDAARLLMHFIPTPLERDFPHAGRYLWQGSATDRCYISYIGGATQHQLHDSCVASNLYLCQKGMDETMKLVWKCLFLAVDNVVCACSYKHLAWNFSIWLIRIKANDMYHVFLLNMSRV